MNKYIAIYFRSGDAISKSFDDEDSARNFLKEIFDTGEGCPDCLVLSNFDGAKILWCAGYELENLKTL